MSWKVDLTSVVLERVSSVQILRVFEKELIDKGTNTLVSPCGRMGLANHASNFSD